MSIKVKDFTKKNYILQCILYYSFCIIFLALIALDEFILEQNFIIVSCICSLLMFIIAIFKTYALIKYLKIAEIKKGTITEIKYVRRGYVVMIESKGKSYICSYQMVSFTIKQFQGLECSFVVNEQNKAYLKTIYN